MNSIMTAKIAEKTDKAKQIGDKSIKIPLFILFCLLFRFI